MRWTFLPRTTNAAWSGRRSRVVLTPRRWCQVSRRFPRGDGGNKARFTKEVSRKTIARGMPGETGVTVVDLLAVLFIFRTRGFGRNGRPAFPAPSSEGHDSAHSPGDRSRRGEGGGLVRLRGCGKPEIRRAGPEGEKRAFLTLRKAKSGWIRLEYALLLDPTVRTRLIYPWGILIYPWGILVATSSRRNWGPESSSRSESRCAAAAFGMAESHPEDGPVCPGRGRHLWDHCRLDHQCRFPFACFGRAAHKCR